MVTPTYSTPTVDIFDPARPIMSAAHEPAAEPRRRDGCRVLYLNHRRDLIGDALEGLAAAGFEVSSSDALRETRDILAQSRQDKGVFPDTIVIAPLVLRPGSVEAEMLEAFQRGTLPVPVLLVVDDLRDLEAAEELAIPVWSFVCRPFSIEEMVRRIRGNLRTQQRLRHLDQRARDLENQVSVDFKTGLLSERHFKKLLQAEFNRAQRHHLPLSLALVDVDNFKGVNDSTEYAFGDRVLLAVAQVLKENTRESDFAARFGGDEFVVLLPHTTAAEAVSTALRICQRVAATAVEHGSYNHRVTVSIGIDTFDGRASMTPDELRRNANKALHEAKHRGKNQVWLHSGDANSPTSEESL